MKIKPSICLASMMAMAIALLVLGSCNEEDSSVGVNGACVLTSAPSYFSGLQIFDYNQAGFLTTRKYEFGFPGFGPFAQIIDDKQSYYSYTSAAGLVDVHDILVKCCGYLNSNS